MRCRVFLSNCCVWESDFDSPVQFCSYAGQFLYLSILPTFIRPFIFWHQIEGSFYRRTICLLSRDEDIDRSVQSPGLPCDGPPMQLVWPIYCLEISLWFTAAGCNSLCDPTNSDWYNWHLSSCACLTTLGTVVLVSQFSAPAILVFWLLQNRLFETKRRQLYLHLGSGECVSSCCHGNWNAWVVAKGHLVWRSERNGPAPGSLRNVKYQFVVTNRHFKSASCKCPSRCIFLLAWTNSCQLT